MPYKEQTTNRVRLCPDGKYRWEYEVPMLKNPSILTDVYKVLGISIGIVWLFMILLTACDGDLGLESLWFQTRLFLLIFILMAVLGALGYLIVAWVYGWKYEVRFTLDEKQLVHEQMPGQMKKAKMLGRLTTIVGLLARKPSVAGAGMLSASRSTTTSTLANVARLIPCRRRNLIKVNQLLNKNRVYVSDEDFDLVYDFLCRHCTKAKKG